MGIKQAEAARQVGISRQAISQRIARGAIATLPDGTLSERTVAELRGAIDPERIRVAKIARPAQAPKVRSVNRAPEPEDISPVLDAELEACGRFVRVLSRRGRLGLGIRSVPRDVVNGHMAVLHTYWFETFEAHVRNLAPKVGYDEETIERVLESTWERMSKFQYTWMCDKAGLIYIDARVPRWTRNASTGRRVVIGEESLVKRIERQAAEATARRAKPRNASVPSRERQAG